MKSVLRIILTSICCCFALVALPQKAAKPGILRHPTRTLLLRDEGLSQLSFINLADSTKNWFLPVPPGRDLQLVGKGLVLIGTGNGYEEREIATGKKVFELTSFPGTITARRLRNGNTLVTGLEFQGKKGVVLVEIDRSGSVKNAINFEQYGYPRLVRETNTGTFLVTADDEVFEATRKGDIVWRTKFHYAAKPHVWQAVRIGSQTLVSTGYAKNFQRFDAAGKLIDSITGPETVNPHFYAGFQILKNGNYVVTNWQGHGPKFGASGVQLLEYTPGGKLAWSWKQDAARFSSLQGVIVLDGLDLDKMYVENGEGKLAAVK